MKTWDGVQLPTFGIYPGIPHDAYHEHPAVSKSGLDRLDQSPAHFKAYLDGEDKDTDAKRIGRLCHMAILEPTRFETEAVVAPDINRRTNAGRAEWEEWQKLHVGCEIIKDQAEADMLRRIQDSVLSHKTAGGLLACQGQSEVSAFWTDQETEIACRCRPDKVLGGGVIIDLKSARDASPYGFAKAVADHRYHVQQAFYLDGFTAAGSYANTFIFVAFEKEPPFAACCHQLQPEDVEEGRAAYRRNLATLARCRAENRWPSYADDIVQITLPGWARKELRS